MSTRGSNVMSKGIKKLSQNDLRKLMSEHKKKLVQTSKQIESPLAKYLDDGTLLCIVCDSVVRSDAVWNVHINSKKHKDNIARKKQAVTQNALDPPKPVPVPQVNPFKRPPEPEEEEIPPAPSKKLKGILKNAPPLPPGFFDNQPVKSETLLHNTLDLDNKTNEENGFNDKKEETEIEQEITTETVHQEPDLPEGFFDDPILDAKARNVEYKDPIQEEWERFQKEIKEENSVSAQIIQDDTEVATVERQIIEVDEQLRNWSRVLDLEKKKEIVQSSALKARDIKMETNSSSSESEDDVDEFLDWRSKKSFK